MSAHRDYFLRHLGIGEVWTLRQLPTMLHSVELEDSNDELKMSASSISSHESEPLRLQQDIAQCHQCSLCRTTGKQSWSADVVDADILFVYDWSEYEFFELQKGLEFERLVSNILKSISVEGSRFATVSLLNSQMPKTNLAIPTQDSSRHCGMFLGSLLRLSRARHLFVFGAKVANILLHSQHEIQQLRSSSLSFNDTPMTVTHSPYELLANSQLKRDIWQDLCRVRALLTK